jgi:mono/diheme cytochrome c family protein
MSKLGVFFAGILLVIVVILLGGGAFVMGAHGFSARVQAGPFERWIARRARQLAVPADARSRGNPAPDSAETLAEARAHWADHCAACHSNNGSGDTEMGKHMYPQAPDMRQRETQQLTDGELFFMIQNGIRLTGMPAWGGGSGQEEQESWKLVRFIRHLPQSRRKGSF